MACLHGLDTVILAGGQGTRLQPVISDRPKVLALVNGRPFLHYLLGQVRSHGVGRVILALGYLSHKVEAYLQHETWEGLEIVSAVEPSPLGTGGALRALLPLIRSPVVLVLNGDSFTQIDLCRFLEFHRSRSARSSIALTHSTEVDRYGLVETDEDGLVTSFMEKPPPMTFGGYVNAGLYLMEQAAIRDISQEPPVSLEREVFPLWIRRGLYAMKGSFPFIDIGTPESYHLAPAFFGATSHDR